jgi:hypothetical protein
MKRSGIYGNWRGRINRGWLGLWRDLRTKEGEADVDWPLGPTCQRGKERTEGTDLVCLLGRGWLLFWAGIHPRSPFSIFPFFSSFSFLFSLFLHILFKFDSNWFKPTLKSF